LVHSLEEGKPNLDRFMENLHEAMTKSEDPEFMRQVSARYKDKRMQKQYARPPIMAQNDNSSIPSLRGSID